ncbi:hypothetical protein LX16_2405 [Stackebrandtia albiflava]|uniref:Uncharacterized protein n=1 Tax=Stackebrandtia albiflava TaxID=406432 RepID=A0A562V1C5_9ACTN|nr:hypothetical protein [Stackebrandtia albiflava]TWJ11678.1 hypothetical protein LX16_2405 [Stackebrandtia albiflava]
MRRIIERIGDGLLKRVLPDARATAQTCRPIRGYCVSPSNACPCHSCLMECWDCAGHTTCSARGACC